MISHMSRCACFWIRSKSAARPRKRFHADRLTEFIKELE